MPPVLFGPAARRFEVEVMHQPCFGFNRLGVASCWPTKRGKNLVECVRCSFCSCCPSTNMCLFFLSNGASEPPITFDSAASPSCSSSCQYLRLNRTGLFSVVHTYEALIDAFTICCSYFPLKSATLRLGIRWNTFRLFLSFHRMTTELLTAPSDFFPFRFNCFVDG